MRWSGTIVETSLGYLSVTVIAWDAAAGPGEFIGRARITKDALNHNFDSKDALATAIVERGTNLTRDAFRRVC